jgi:hypothetical protein
MRKIVTTQICALQLSAEKSIVPIIVLFLIVVLAN